MVDAIVRALSEHEGDILAFLPGQREIRREKIIYGKTFAE